MSSTPLSSDTDLDAAFAEIEAQVAQELKDWNVAGLGVGIVIGDTLRFAKGFGYRDLGAKAPFTEKTLIPVASNTKLVTSVACGLLVEQGLLTWDRPVKRSVPAIEFFNDHLDANVSLRDMLAHRTGITRHDSIWYKSTFSRPELFARIKLLEPHAPIRTQHIYNNLMYGAAGYLIELQTGITWEVFVKSNILDPLRMTESCFTIPEMRANADHGVPYSEKRDNFELESVPFYEDTEGVAPCGALISNLSEMSHWIAALLNDGKYEGQSVIPPSILNATLEPAIGMPNLAAETKGYWEILNTVGGMGRVMSVYRGHLLTSHGGYLDGFHTQVSMMPRHKIGVAAFVIGDHAGALPNAISYNIYERLLGMDLTPWSKRFRDDRLAGKEAAIKKRAEAAAATAKTSANEQGPGHKLTDYEGEYESPSYGIIKIGLAEQNLCFEFNRFSTGLTHVHYERFDTPDDERFGKYSLNFFTNSQGDVERIFMVIDQGEVTFTRKPDAPAIDLIQRMAGGYRSPEKSLIEIAFRAPGELVLTRMAQGEIRLTPYRGLTFRAESIPDLVFTFIEENGSITGFDLTNPTGTVRFPKE